MQSGGRNGEESEGSRGKKDPYHRRVSFSSESESKLQREIEREKKGKGKSSTMTMTSKICEGIQRDTQRELGVTSAFDFRVSICLFRRRSHWLRNFRGTVSVHTARGSMRIFPTRRVDDSTTAMK